MTALRTRAIVLRRTNYGEADRILQFLTPEGKKSVMARGVRREKSKLAGGIELFAVTDIVINQGKGELGILTSARLVHFYRHIMTDYDRMQFGYEAIKQVARASEMVDEPDWYDVLFEVFKGLDALGLALQLTQTWFYLHYSELLGAGLSLSNDMDGHPLQPDQRYTYDVSEKGLRPAVNGEVTADHIKFMRLISVKSLETLAQVGGVESILPDCWSVARQHAAI
ncbi:MAG: DNA repair protein RecO [Candidatus Saccharimonadales bacterium]